MLPRFRRPVRTLDLVNVAIIFLVRDNISLGDDSLLLRLAEEPNVSLKKIVLVAEHHAQLIHILVVLIQPILSEDNKYKCSDTIIYSTIYSVLMQSWQDLETRMMFQQANHSVPDDRLGLYHSLCVLEQISPSDSYRDAPVTLGDLAAREIELRFVNSTSMGVNQYFDDEDREQMLPTEIRKKMSIHREAANAYGKIVGQILSNKLLATNLLDPQ